MVQYQISHCTTYEYTDPVSLCQNVAHLKPRDWPRQVVQSTRLVLSPEPAVIEERLDYFGNPVNYFTVQEPHRTLKVEVMHKILVKSANPPQHNQSPPWEQVAQQLRQDRSQDWLDAYQYTFDSLYAPSYPEFAQYALKSFTPNRPILEAGVELTHRIFTEFVYDPRATTISTPTKEVFLNRRGVCQDFAHFQIGCLRAIGLGVRYISGYLSTMPPPGKPRMIGADATHAWVSLFCGPMGWVDLDPTNDQIPGDRHVLIAWGRDYDDVSPVKGVILGGGQHRVKVSVDVAPVNA
jgi:transglutaminase-like putative cysteine protease